MHTVERYTIDWIKKLAIFIKNFNVHNIVYKKFFNKNIKNVELKYTFGIEENAMAT